MIGRRKRFSFTCKRSSVFGFGVVVGAASVVAATSSSAMECTDIRIENEDALNVTTELEYLFLQAGEKELTRDTIKLKKLNYPLTMSDCGDAKYYKWQYDGMTMLVDQSQVGQICVVVAEGRDSNAVVAGAPGAGAPNICAR